MIFIKKILIQSLLIVFFFTCFEIKADPWDKLESRPCTYLEPMFLKKINKNEVKTIVELGAYNGLDSILLHLHYNCPVFCFECDSVRLKEIKERLMPYPNVTLVPYGAWDETKDMIFYHCNFSGASSFYELDLENLAKINLLSKSELIKQQDLGMTPESVKAIRLDEWMEKNNLKQIDLLCIDVQGACLNALKGMGKYISTVKYIIAEVEYTPYYKDEPLFTEINNYLEQQGFKCFFQTGVGFSNVIFINKNYI